MGLEHLLLSVHRPGGGQMGGLRPFGRRGRRPSFTRDRVHDVDAAILVGEPDAGLAGGARRVFDGGVWVRRVHVLVKIVGPVVFLNPVRHVRFPVIGDGGRRVAETEHLVRGRGRIQLALLRHLPLLPHHPLEILEEIAGRRLIGRGQLLGGGEPRAVRPPGRHRFPLRQSGAPRLLLGGKVERDLLPGAGLRLGRRGRLLNGDPALRLGAGGSFQLGQVRRGRVVARRRPLLHGASPHRVHVRIRPDRLDRVVLLLLLVVVVATVHRLYLRVLPRQARAVPVLLLGAVGWRGNERRRRGEVGRGGGVGRCAGARARVGTVRRRYRVRGVARVNGVLRVLGSVALAVLHRRVAAARIRVHLLLIVGRRSGRGVGRCAFRCHRRRARGCGLFRPCSTNRSRLADQRARGWREGRQTQGGTGEFRGVAHGQFARRWRRWQRVQREIRSEHLWRRWGERLVIGFCLLGDSRGRGWRW